MSETLPTLPISPRGPQTSPREVFGLPVPNAPTIGKLLPSGNGFEPATGGKPNRNWTGPDPLKPTYYTAFHCRFVDLYQTAKQRPVRLKVDHAKDKKGGDVYELGRRLHMHFEEYGMDPIMYAYSPTDPYYTVSVFTSFDELRIKEVEKEIKALMGSKWDLYDLHNNVDALSVLSTLSTTTRCRISTRRIPTTISLLLPVALSPGRTVPRRRHTRPPRPFYCMNRATFWISKGITACGVEPGRPRRTLCAAGTHLPPVLPRVQLEGVVEDFFTSCN
jgi:hypothetical protein